MRAFAVFLSFASLATGCDDAPCTSDEDCADDTECNDDGECEPPRLSLALVGACDQPDALSGVSDLDIGTSEDANVDTVVFGNPLPAFGDASSGTTVFVTARNGGEELSTGQTTIASTEEDTLLVTMGAPDSFAQTTDAGGNCVTMRQARHGHTATWVAGIGKVLIYGGAVFDDDGTERFLNTAELWDPSTGTFTTIETGGGSPGRAYHAATALPDGRVVLSGGFGTVSSTVVILLDVDVFDPSTEELSVTTVLRQPRAHHTSTLMEGAGIVVIAGGCAGSGPADLCSPTQAGNGESGESTDLPASIETLDVDTLTVAPAPVGLQTGRAFHQATSLENGPQTLLIVTGGANGAGPVCDAEIFRRVAGELTRVDGGPIQTTFPPNKCPVRHAAVAAINPATNQPRVLMIGGQQAAPGGAPQGPGTVDVFEFTTTGGIAPFAPLVQGRAGHVAATLDERVLVIGGSTGTGPVAELLAPAVGTGVISSTAVARDPSSSRERGALAVSPTGAVLFTGGHTIDGPLTTVETAEMFFAR